MLKIRLIVIIFLGLSLTACTPSQKLKQPEIDVEKNADKEMVFPDDWMGYWKGDLEIFKENKLTRTLPMALDHAYTDTTGYYKWAIIYGPDSIAGRRDYYLKTVDAEKGHYQTDERNSIFLDSYLFGDQLIAYYDVGTFNIQSIYTRSGEELHFEINVFGQEPIATTGNQIIDGDTIPEVRSYPVTTKQKAILRRVR